MNADSRKRDAIIISREDKAWIGRMMYSCTCAYICDCVLAMNAFNLSCVIIDNRTYILVYLQLLM